MKHLLLTSLFVASSITGAMAQKYFEKQVVFPANATAAEKIDMASRLVPTKQQLEWQRMELTAFLHFGVNTFTGNEWGNGKEDPSIFNPSDLDCEQWVRTLKNAGFKMAIITAKHHDGFCLWPSKTTKHSVASSKWKDGKGDVVRELRNACKKYGLKFGVYLSPWDRNAECYGDTPAYNRFFIEQLTELLTNYGEVHEVWFDGANGEGPNGKKQEYDWDSVLSTIHRLQPKAVTAIMGDDVRWVGNERGLGRETEWSATVLTPSSLPQAAKNNTALNIDGMKNDLGSREMVAKATEMHWYPSEVDVSIRPGWFYHASQDNQVKSLKNLSDIYFQSAGYNSVLLLNIPPDQRGHIHENDSIRLCEFSAYLKETFSQNYLAKNKAWTGTNGKTYEYAVKKGATVNAFMLQEDITKGQRMEDFLVEALINGKWTYLGEGTTVGYKRLIQFSDCTPERIRVTIRSCRGTANIANAGLFYAKPIADNSEKLKLSDVDVKEWKIANGNNAMQSAIDGDIKTVYRGEGLQALTVDMGKDVSVKGFCYAPAADGNLKGTIYQYEFYVSNDGNNWTKCEASNEFSNIMHNPIPYFVRFGKAYNARYFKLVPTAEINGQQCTSIGEVGILTK